MKSYGIKVTQNRTGNVSIMSHSGAFGNHFCNGKAMSSMYSECVSVALFTK